MSWFTFSESFQVACVHLYLSFAMLSLKRGSFFINLFVICDSLKECFLYYFFCVSILVFWYGAFYCLHPILDSLAFIFIDLWPAYHSLLQWYVHFFYFVFSSKLPMLCAFMILPPSVVLSSNQYFNLCFLLLLFFDCCWVLIFVVLHFQNSLSCRWSLLVFEVMPFFFFKEEHNSVIFCFEQWI